jgi:hypothetical protein
MGQPRVAVPSDTVVALEGITAAVGTSNRAVPLTVAVVFMVVQVSPRADSLPVAAVAGNDTAQAADGRAGDGNNRAAEPSVPLSQACR